MISQIHSSRFLLVGLTFVGIIGCDMKHETETTHRNTVRENDILLTDYGVLDSWHTPLLVEDHLVFSYWEGGSAVAVTIDASRLADYLLATHMEVEVEVEVSLPDGSDISHRRSIYVSQDQSDIRTEIELPFSGFGTYAVTLTQLVVDGELVFDNAFVGETMTLEATSSMWEDQKELSISESAAACGPGDTINGTIGANALYGSDGNDEISGKAGADLIKGNGCNDILHGNLGKDDIWGGPGDDYIHGGWGKDTCRGGPGNDYFRSCKTVQS